ncbi:MAG: UDP-3-O-(3-hydroxymyristoyl)glucosamine N-acyltransferase [Rhodocyclaceae bacterium]|nr:UDP-3-O-(3-hydroxymyristoyl)glucosamine N-acyltransferase [Rhodocyclaceae bacterium]
MGSARSFLLTEIVATLGGELIGDGAVAVERVATLENAGPDAIGFLANPRYKSQVAASRAGAIILSPKLVDITDVPRIVADDPYLYFARLAQLLNPPPAASGVVAATAAVESPLPSGTEVGPGAWIGPEVSIGRDVIIGAGCHVGAGVTIGDGTRLYPGVSIYPGCQVGARCILHSGVVIGADGFGFARSAEKEWVKIPQTGRVVIGDDVEVGANTSIDRGAIDDTVIEDGVKLDNQIQIGHNVRIGRHSIVAAAAAIAGSTHIGERCMIGGMVGIVGHLEIADDVVVSGGTVVAKSLRKPGMYTSIPPLQPHADWVRNFSHIRHLDAMADKIRALEHRISELEEGSSPR